MWYCIMDEKGGGRLVALRFVKVEVIGELSEKFHWSRVVWIEALFKWIGERE